MGQKKNVSYHSRNQTISFDPDKKLRPFSESTKQVLRNYLDRYMDALKKGENYREAETRKFGGNPLPGEPGSESYFDKLNQ
jgi:hypothetical protein